MSRGRHGTAFTAAVLPMALSLALASALSAAEKRACDAETDVKLKASLERIQQQVDAIWVKRGPDWIAAYDIAGTPKNPFDVSDQGSGSEAVHGFAWLRDVGCAMSEATPEGARVVTYRAAAYRFKEGDTEWTKPMTDGVIAEYVVSPGDADWQIKDNSKDETIFLPDGTMRRPRQAELPAQKLWPDKRCRLPKVWNGQSCGEDRQNAPRDGGTLR